MTTEAATSVPVAEPESYAFVMNVLELTDGKSYELAPGHVLRRAMSDEISVIKNTIKRFVGLLPSPSLMEHFRNTSGHIREVLTSNCLSKPGGTMLLPSRVLMLR